MFDLNGDGVLELPELDTFLTTLNINPEKKKQISADLHGLNLNGESVLNQDSFTTLFGMHQDLFNSIQETLEKAFESTASQVLSSLSVSHQ